MNKVLYVVINKELKMSAGKAAAQAVHAAMMLEGKNKPRFADNYRRTVIVLEANSTQQLKNLSYYLEDVDVACEYYIDEGKNEVDAFSATALAVGLIDEEDTEKRDIFAGLKLYTYEDEVTEKLVEYAKAMTSVQMTDKIERKSNPQQDALRALHELRFNYQYYDGVEAHDTTPRWLRKAIKKLEKM